MSYFNYKNWRYHGGESHLGGVLGVGVYLTVGTDVWVRFVLGSNVENGDGVVICPNLRLFFYCFPVGSGSKVFCLVRGLLYVKSPFFRDLQNNFLKLLMFIIVVPILNKF